MAIFIIGVWVFLIVMILLSSKKGKIRLKKRNEVYEKVASEKVVDISKYINMLTTNKDLESARKSYKNSKIYILIFLVILGTICLIFKFFNPFIIFVAVVGSIIIFSIANSKYSKIYKEQVITSIINSYDKELRYNPTSGITRDVYRTAKFEYFDRYHTEDLIVGKIQGYEFALADVHTEKESTDSDGNTTYTTIFRGPVAVLELNKLTDLMLYISDNQLKLFKGQYVELDNQAFEEKYDVFSNDDVVAMRILTPTITTKILEMHDKYGFFFEIKLINGLLFFRFHSDTLFEPSPGNIEKEATDIAFYFNMLDGMKAIMNEIVKILNEFER
jgi:hypothetical protein